MKLVVEAVEENRVYPVTDMINEMGEHTDDKDKAVAIVVEREGVFYTITIHNPACIHTLH